MTGAQHMIDRMLASLTRRGWGRGDVQGGVAVEESNWLEPERDNVNRHYRPFLGTGDVVDAERVPEHHIGVFDGPVCGGPFRQPHAGAALIDEFSRRPTFIRIVRRHPKRVRDGFCALEYG